MRLGRETTAHVLTQLVVSASGFVSTFAIAFLLGARGLGVYAIGVAIGYFWIQIPADAYAAAIAKRISEGDSPGAMLTAGLLVVSAAGLGSAAVILASSALVGSVGQLAETAFGRVLFQHGGDIAMMALFASLYKGVAGGLQGQQLVAMEGLLDASERTVRAALQVGAMVSGYGVGALFLAHAGSLLLVVILGLVVSNLQLERPRLGHLRRLYTYAQFSWLGTVESRAFGWMDTLVLSFIAPANLIGIYEAAWGMASLLGVAGGSIQRTLFPEVSRLSVSDATDRIVHYLDEGLAYSGILVIPGLVGTVVIGNRLLQFYRPSFEQGAGILVVLVAANGVSIYGSQFLNVLNAVDRPDLSFAVSLRFIAVNVLLNIGMGFAFGWWGVAAATAISATLRLALAHCRIRKQIGPISVPTVELGWQGLAAMLMGVFVLVGDAVLPVSRVYTVLLVVTAAALYGLLLVGVSARVRSKTLMVAQSLSG
jgi:O-antigen/teichoic acid export membrane protein